MNKLSMYSSLPFPSHGSLCLSFQCALRWERERGVHGQLVHGHQPVGTIGRYSKQARGKIQDSKAVLPFPSHCTLERKMQSVSRWERERGVRGQLVHGHQPVGTIGRYSKQAGGKIQDSKAVPRDGKEGCKGCEYGKDGRHIHSLSIFLSQVPQDVYVLVLLCGQLVHGHQPVGTIGQYSKQARGKIQDSKAVLPFPSRGTLERKTQCALRWEKEQGVCGQLVHGHQPVGTIGRYSKQAGGKIQDSKAVP